MSFAPWIKIEITTPDKPEVVAMAARLRMKDPDTVTGKLVRLWCWADANSVDGHDLAITREFIDRLTYCRGFAAAMESVGWLVEQGGLLSFPRFDRHNGDSAKKRASEARKKQRQRAGDGSGKNVPTPAGQNRGPEEEIESGERERADEASPESPFAEVSRWVLTMRPEWSASPALNAAEEQAMRKNLPALARITPEVQAVMRRYLAAKLPEGSAGWQPRQRLRFIETAGDVAAQAVAWDHGAGGQSRPAEDIPAGFLEWARERYPASKPRILWSSESARNEWKKSA